MHWTVEGWDEQLLYGPVQNNLQEVWRFFLGCVKTLLWPEARAFVQIEAEMRDVLRKVGILPKWAIISKMVVGRRSWTWNRNNFGFPPTRRALAFQPTLPLIMIIIDEQDEQRATKMMTSLLWKWLVYHYHTLAMPWRRLGPIQILEYQTDMRRCRLVSKPSSLLRSYIAG